MEEEKDFWKTQLEREAEIHALKVKEFADCERARQAQIDAQIRVEKDAAARHEDWLRVNYNAIAKITDISIQQLSFRDSCAIAVMTGVCAQDDRYSSVEKMVGSAFNIADAMEAERQKRSAK